MKKNIYFGDIHNHNACGYGKGSLLRAIDVARNHLDFFAFTGHSNWHDMEAMEGGREQHWHKGFAKLDQEWPEVQRLIAEANDDGKFVAFLGFEWHSNAYGDHCVIFPDDYGDRIKPDHIEELRQFCREHDALMIPHHLAYPTGRRGVNWEVFEPSCSPIVEVFSEHGNSEDDRGLYPFFNHSFGGRMTANTIRHALDRGLRFGVYASSDSHSGFPGAYGEGVTGLIADDLSRKSVFEAIRARRVYGLTGDRIEISFSANGLPMGADLPSEREIDIEYTVRGRDEIEVVELILNGEVVDRRYPDSRPHEPGHTEQVRIEWGWGPWGDLALERIADWEFDLSLTEGRIIRAFPCWQSGPFAEDRRHTARRHSDSAYSVSSYTSRKGAYRQNPNQSIVLEIEAAEKADLQIALRQPARSEHSFSVPSLRDESAFVPTGPFPKESMLVHRSAPDSATVLAERVVLKAPPGRSSYLYLRVRQKNGQLAWTSPVFMDPGK